MAAHTYSAAGTFKTAHFAGNAAGVSAAVQDVVVPAAAIKITITASQWLWTPANVDLKVGQPYEITFLTDPNVSSVHHGVGGPVEFGVLGPPAHCDQLNPSCVWNFTPTAAMLNLPGPVYLYGCTQSVCGIGHSSMAVGAVNGGSVTIVP